MSAPDHAPAIPPRCATPVEGAVEFALAAPHATRVELVLFAPGARGHEERRLELAMHDDGYWHASVPGVGPGQHYGYRVHGPYELGEGHRFNPAKLLLDPFARAVSGPVEWNEVLTCGRWDHEAGREVPDERDSAPALPRGVVVDPSFDWQGDEHPYLPLGDSVLYECHVRGATMRHPDVPEHQRGRFLGLCSPPMLDHFRSLGITAVQLMPVQQMAVERHLVERGLTNYWGYNTVGFFAPDGRFASGRSGEQVHEFKQMVRTFHAAGMEVLLDVVLNHTGEGDVQGPMCLLRGVDNIAYYRLAPHEPARYIDITGTGNTLRCSGSLGRELVLESLRYWADEMHVDGFRFDMAPALARNEHGIFEPDSSFFAALRDDPHLSALKLIAEPWDLGHDGYQIGGFPRGWSEWNGKFRDGVRRFWTGAGGLAPEFAMRVTGSSDLYATNGRSPLASINYVTCHDGFTLTDLVSYEAKHNEANGENNQDGPSDNYNRNWGTEGPSADPAIALTRARVAKSLLGTIIVARGVPMLSHGDELGRTQWGNNNAYCHDDDRTWLDWSPDAIDHDRLAFLRAAIALRLRTPGLRRDWFGNGIGGPAVEWFRADGGAMEEADWHDPGLRAVGMLTRDSSGGALLMLVNPTDSTLFWTLPDWTEGCWREQLTSGAPGSGEASHETEVAAHTLVMFAWEKHGG